MGQKCASYILEQNHSCSDTRRVHIIWNFTKLYKSLTLIKSTSHRNLGRKFSYFENPNSDTYTAVHDNDKPSNHKVMKTRRIRLSYSMMIYVGRAQHPFLIENLLGKCTVYGYNNYDWPNKTKSFLGRRSISGSVPDPYLICLLRILIRISDLRIQIQITLFYKDSKISEKRQCCYLFTLMIQLFCLQKFPGSIRIRK